MRPSFRRPSRRRLTLAAVPVTGLALVATLVPASGEESTRPDPESFSWSFQGEGEERAGTADFRDGAVAPTPAQEQRASAIGATTARWNQFGTPRVLLNHSGYLSGARDGQAADVARAFVAENADLFKLSPDGVDSLEVVTDSPLLEGPDLARQQQGEQVSTAGVPHVVTFRQSFADGLVAGNDGLLTVGVQRDGRVAYVSSSVTGDEAVEGEQQLGAAEALAEAAADVELPLGDLSDVTDRVDGPWQSFTSSLTGDLQRARLMALPTPDDGTRLAWETTLLASQHSDEDGHGSPAAYISFVDAQTGEVLLRDDRVDHLAEGLEPPGAPTGGQFQGSTDDQGACTPEPHGPYAVAEGNDQVQVVAATTLPNGIDDDITINLYRDEELVASQDLLTSPEALSYAPEGGVPAGDYFVEVCEFTPASGSIGYAGVFAASAGAGGGGGFTLPRWRVFPANPNFTDSGSPDADTRELWCWENDGSGSCDERQRNTAARLPWDVLAPSTPTFSTQGNQAATAISEFSFLSPDTAVQRPVSPDREYDYDWNNTWYNSDCDPTVFDQPGGNDDDASVANLFASHNRMHDWSYYLGFTERNSNLQQSNFGTTEATRENDPEIGNAQAGRRTFNGRDNANQITLQDGIAPITNQYLWQPLAGAFYAACTDGAYDMAVVAHEYGHAISNRMIAGPDTGTGATQGQTESWSDLIFAEYFRGKGISTGPGANPFALAPYVSGNKQRGIRNYGMNASPLNYSDLEYDGNGTTSPHADGEIWSAVNFDIAEALNEKYDRRPFRSTNETLQLKCSKGRLPANKCPGNRRWAQIMFDGFLLTPSGSTMLDSRDAMLAADRLRFNGRNQAVLWRAFARRGMGETAFSADADDRQPRPGWSSPLARDEATVTFRSPAPRTKVYTGAYEARISPTADNRAKSRTPARVEFVPGTYRFIAQAPGRGAVRFTRTFRPGQETVVKVPLRRNLASAANGARATGDGINVDKLIDDTEATNWASLEPTAGTEGQGEGEQVAGRQVTVNLSGRRALAVDRVQVSAALRPTDAEDADSGSQSRFSALRSFDILVCNARQGGCADEGDFRVAFRSANDAFPGVRPRPTAPDLTLRAFTFDAVRATHVRLRVRDSQCTGGPSYQAAANPSADPVFSNPDCDSEETTPDRAVLTPPKDQVRVAELQVFGSTR